MGAGLVQVLQAVALTAVAVGAHRAIHRMGRSYAAHLEEVAGRAMAGVTAISEVLGSIVYAAFIAAAQPVGGGLAPAAQLESGLDTVALFGLVVVAVELIRLRVLRQVALALEPWPPAPDAAVTA